MIPIVPLTTVNHTLMNKKKQTTMRHYLITFQSKKIKKPDNAKYWTECGSTGFYTFVVGETVNGYIHSFT